MPNDDGEDCLSIRSTQNQKRSSAQRTRTQQLYSHSLSVQTPQIPTSRKGISIFLTEQPTFPIRHIHHSSVIGILAISFREPVCIPPPVYSIINTCSTAAPPGLVQ